MESLYLVFCFLAIESHWGLESKQNVKQVVEANLELLHEKARALVWMGGQKVLHYSQPPVAVTTECKESSLFHFAFLKQIIFGGGPL